MNRTFTIGLAGVIALGCASDDGEDAEGGSAGAGASSQGGSAQGGGGQGGANQGGAGGGIPGDHLWSKRFGGDDILAGDSGFAITTDAAGDVYFTGLISNVVDFGGGPLDMGGPEDIFVTKLDASGEHVWSKRFGDGYIDSGTGIATTSDGDVVVVGHFRGTVDFGGGALTSSRDAAFLLRLDGDGNHVWSKRFGDDASGHSVAVDDDDGIVMAGSFTGSIDFGGGALQSDTAAAFVAKLNGDGSHVWSHSFGSDQGSACLSCRTNAQALALDDDGNVFIAGSFSGDADFGDEIRESVPDTNMYPSDDMFVVKLGADGQTQWSRSFGDTDMDRAEGIAVDGAGNFVVTGRFGGTVDFGGGPLTSGQGGAILVAQYDAGGAHLWSRQYGGDGGFKAGRGVAIDDTGHVFFTGEFAGEADFGGGVVTSTGEYQDGFLVKLDQSGQHVWSKQFAGAEGHGVCTDRQGHVLATGAFAGTADFGGGELAAEKQDIFVAKYWR